MKYQEFLQNVEKEIKKKLENGEELFIQRFPKNNGITYDGLVIFHPEFNISPTIYLNQYYHWYLDGTTLEDICDNIMDTYTARLPKKDFDTSLFTEYDNARHFIIMKLINYEHNRELLQQVPYVRMLDLAIVFQCLVSQQTNSFATILIHNHHLKYWGITKEHLSQDAFKNTPKLLPYELEDMEELIRSNMMSVPGEISFEECPMYILTNSAKLNGATAIFYEGLMKKLAEEMETDFIILPSSIHETLLVPVNSPEQISFFSQMVEQVNETELADDEILSDHAYYYSRKDNRFYLPEGIPDMKKQQEASA